MKLTAFLSRILGIQPVPVSQPSTVKVPTMTLSEAKTYLEAHLALAEADIKLKYQEVVAWVETKLANDAAMTAAEIAHLQTLGYTVTPPPAV